MRQVTAGAKFLDEHRPGWEDEIDLDELDLESTCGCVLGQLHGHDHPYSRLALRYERMQKRLGLTDDDAARLGFNVEAEMFEDEPVSTVWYARMTESWKRVIRKRRRAVV